MNNDEINKGIKNLHGIKLTDQEKQSVLASILKETVEAQKRSSKNYWQFVFRKSMWHRHLTRTIAICLIVLLGGSSTIFASENSLPGDLLYPIKINIAEPAGDILTVGVTSQARREAEKTGRRLAEAEKLVNKGDLNPVENEEIRKQIQNRLDKFESLRQKLEKTSPVEEVVSINSELEAQINAHASILEEISEHASSSQKTEIDQLKETIKENKDHIKKGRELVEEKLIAEHSKTKEQETEYFEDSTKKIDDSIKDTRKKLIDSYRDSKGITKEILDNASGTLREAENMINEAKDKINAGQSDEAISSLFSARRNAEEASISVKKSSDFSKNSGSKDEKKEDRKKKNKDD